MKRNYILIPIGGGGGGKQIELSPLTVTENGVYTADEDKGYNEVSVSVADIPAVTEPLNVTENGTYTPSSGVDGFSEVSVNVPDIPAVTEPLNVTENGTYTTPEGVDGYNTVSVNVPTTDVQNLTISQNGTYSAPEGVSYGNIEVSVPAVDVSVVSKLDSVEVLGYTSLQADIYVASNKTISSCGVEVSETSDFVEVVSYTSASNSNGAKNVHITGLTPNTTYYIRSFVIVNGVNYNQEPFNSSTTIATPAMPESIPATATKMVTANTDVVNLKFKRNSPDEVVYIDWGDGAENGSTIPANTSYGSSGTIVSHTYSEVGVYDVYIWSESSTDTTYGKMPAFYQGTSGNDMKIARIETPLQKVYNGSLETSASAGNALEYAFAGCASLEYVCPTLLENIHYYKDGVNKTYNDCYRSMFQNCTSLTTVPELPATTLANNCYDSMFYGCSSLTTVPELPATTLASSCYYNMFNGCSSLTTVPELPATTLEYGCYDSMFRNCSSLTTAPALPATTLAGNCYQNMFYNCSSLTTAPALPATTLAGNCYQNMFYSCSSLTTAPELPATTLANNCYNQMFQNCTSLTTAPELPATTLVISCYYNMFNGCHKLQSVTTYATTWNTSYANYWLGSAGIQATNPTLYCPANSTLKNYTNNYSGIPTGWTQVDLPTE